MLSRHSSTGKIGRFGLTKYRKFVENPDPEEFKKIKFEDGKNEISGILEAINMLEKDSSDGRVYMDELATNIRYECSSIRKIFKR